ncbi:MAG: hypothetical protein AAF517_28570 [Planctomycetota bacterium]
MGYYLRFLTERSPPALAEIEAGLKAADARYAIPHEEREGELHRGDELLGEIELNVPGDGLFDEEIKELLEELEDVEESKARAEIEVRLQEAKGVVAVRVLWQAPRKTEATLEMIEPLWEWLFANCPGVLQADDGYYGESDQLVSLE